MVEPLAVLLQLHLQAVEEQRRALIAVSERWDVVAAAANAVRRELAAETARAGSDGGDGLAEAFAAWLPIAMAKLVAAERDEAETQAEIVRQRANLAAARAAARAAELELQARAADRITDSTRQAQAELDEAGLRAHRPATACPPWPD